MLESSISRKTRNFFLVGFFLFFDVEPKSTQGSCILYYQYLTNIPIWGSLLYYQEDKQVGTDNLINKARKVWFSIEKMLLKSEKKNQRLFKSKLFHMPVNPGGIL